MGIIIAFNLALLSLGIFVIIKGFIIIFKFLQSVELTNSIEYNMIIINRFPRDIKSLSINRTFKRNFYAFFAKNKSQYKEKLDEPGVKGTKQIVEHPVIVAETKNGDVVIANLTSTSIVTGKPATPIGIKKNGETSFFIFDKNNIVKKNKAVIINNYINKDNCSDVKFISENASNNIINNIEEMTGKELKNKWLEKVSFKEPIDKI
jgi:hypothetical protein